QVDERKFGEYLYLQTAPDLIIRTGGVQRLSGFMPWHTGYSELYFSKKMWPEFQRADFQDALTYFASTKRNFGK
ncbi:undecaprenyl diphosphate synthase family protein, partial [Candidatus Micrarchaeota archaeon]|nr:undecaprenyl diphosphate synthase family protein [Candidatus Micrarchaeota archaeon]